MRIIRMPDNQEEYEVHCCYCNALLAYTDADCSFKPGLAGSAKIITCPVCNHELAVEWVPTCGAPRKPKSLDIIW